MKFFRIQFLKCAGPQLIPPLMYPEKKKSDLLDRLALSDAPDDFEAQIAEKEVLELLRSRADAYSGVARLGIEALELKVKGMSVTEIAKLYDVPPSHVGAWISRSAQKLRKDNAFLAALCSEQ